jgi:hypothetical protein
MVGTAPTVAAWRPASSNGTAESAREDSIVTSQLIRCVGNGWMGIFIDRDGRGKSAWMIANAKGERMKCCAGQRGSRGQSLVAFARKGKNHLGRLESRCKQSKKKSGKNSNRDRSWQEPSEYLDLRPWQSGVRKITVAATTQLACQRPSFRVQSATCQGISKGTGCFFRVKGRHIEKIGD